MSRRMFLASLALCLVCAPAVSVGADVPEPVRARGLYVEARTCDVWTGPCFANADFNLGGKNAVLAWKVNDGSAGGLSLNGLGIVAVVAAHNTLGLEQVGPARSVLIVDERATADQKA